MLPCAKWTRHKRVAHTTHEMISSPTRWASSTAAEAVAMAWKKWTQRWEMCAEPNRKNSMQFTWRRWIFIIDAMSHAACSRVWNASFFLHFFCVFVNINMSIKLLRSELSDVKIATLMITFSINRLIDSLVVRKLCIVRFVRRVTIYCIDVY